MSAGTLVQLACQLDLGVDGLPRYPSEKWSVKPIGKLPTSSPKNEPVSFSVEVERSEK